MGRRTIGEPKPIRRMGPLTIESVDIEAQGIARHEGKVVFVAGALMGEEVMVSRREQGVSRTARIIAKDAFVSEASRNVRYRAVLDNRDIGIVAGALVAVQVPLGDVRVAAVVPITSVRRDSFGARVFVLRPAEEGARAPERAEVRLVSLGPQRGDMVIVAKGLQTGEKIAAGGAFKLRDGVLVNAIPATHALTSAGT